LEKADSIEIVLFDKSLSKMRINDLNNPVNLSISLDSSFG